jgi:cellulose synthase/poly-beta-1,6-N-acetylglucosamine synthase-like glycosyltransferase
MNGADARRALTPGSMTESDRRLFRAMEFVPAGLVWATFIAAVGLAFWHPIAMIAFIIAFDLYWFLRVLYFVIFLTASWNRHRRMLKVDWESELKRSPGWERLRHLVFLPTYKEDLSVLRKSVRGLAEAAYPRKKMIIVLAGEERAGKEAFLRRAEAVRAEFGDRFLKFIVTVHPSGLEGEIAGKGSNLHYAGPVARAEIDALGIPHEDVIVSTFDVDTVAHPQYFAHLSKTFIDTPDRQRCSYQPVVLYSNNIWEANSAVRIASFGTTFWLLSELVRSDRLFTFSSHSMPFKALVDAGYWQNDIVSEDSRIFLQCFIRYDGDYRVVPLYVPVSMDAVQAPSRRESLLNLYRQQRRWAWGVEHFPYLVVNFLRRRSIPLRKRVGKLWLLAEGMYTWATAPMLIFILGWLPLTVARLQGREEALFQNAPFTLQALMTLAMLGVFASAVLSLPLLPPRPEHKPRWGHAVMVLQWALLPITFVVFGALPAIEAQTRLALGKRLGFWVTPKTANRDERTEAGEQKTESHVLSSDL